MVNFSEPFPISSDGGRDREQEGHIPVAGEELYLTLPYLTLPYLTLSYLILVYLTLVYLSLPHLTLP